MEFSRFEVVMMAFFVGRTPQTKTSDIHTSIRVYAKIGLSEDEIAQHDGRPVAELLAAKDITEIDLDKQEAKFVTKVMVQNHNFGPNRLKYIVPLWERLYPRWEEFAEERSDREKRGRR